jgi:hypothetical protein
MHGNVWQLIDSAKGWSRLSRGGTWFEDGSFARAAIASSANAPTYRYYDRGLRLARVPVR